MFGFFKSNEIGNSITKNETDSKETFKTLRLKSSEIYDKNLQKLLFENEKVSLVSRLYISSFEFFRYFKKDKRVLFL